MGRSPPLRPGSDNDDRLKLPVDELPPIERLRLEPVLPPEVKLRETFADGEREMLGLPPDDRERLGLPPVEREMLGVPAAERFVFAERLGDGDCIDRLIEGDWPPEMPVDREVSDRPVPAEGVREMEDGCREMLGLPEAELLGLPVLREMDGEPVDLAVLFDPSRPKSLVFEGELRWNSLEKEGERDTLELPPLGLPVLREIEGLRLTLEPFGLE
jgi:hypothetical protein